MNVLDTAKKRYSVRTYEDKPVEKEKLDKILASAHVAPTAANLQPVKLLVVQDKKRLDCIAKAGNIYHAPLAIIVCADHEKAWTRPFDNKQTTDVEAINRILKHYEGYIAVLSTRKLYDEYGNLHYCVDETLRRRLETKLITKILKFKIA